MICNSHTVSTGEARNHVIRSERCLTAAVTSARRTNERTPPSPSKPDSRGSSSISSSGGHEYRRARTKQTTRKRRKRKPLDGARSPGPGTACLGEGRDPGWQRA